MICQTRNYSFARNGVTVIEVLFATGIAIFGLVGIASLISVAGRQASDANKSTEGQAAGQIAYSEFVTRGMNDSSRWRWYNDQLTSARFVNFDSLSGVLRATSVGGARTNFRHAVCIDPGFFADSTTASAIQTTFPSTQLFRPGLFPYFQDNYDPMDPAVLLSANLGRLLRLSLGSSSGVLSAKSAERIFQLADDLAISIDEDDKTLPTERFFSRMASSALGQSLSNGEYSWFATLCPREPSAREIAAGLVSTTTPEIMHTLSIVVCKRRDRSFTTSVVPEGERVLAVVGTVPHNPAVFPASFRGGSGGRVVLAASAPLVSDPARITVNDSLRVGDWLMLCKQQSLGGTNLGTICRWYRVIAVDNEVDDTSTPGVWYRNVILDGPDWVFDAIPTQAIVVNGVVSVVERVIAVD